MEQTQLEELTRRYPALSVCMESIERAFIALRDSYRSQGKLLLCGNGGSASDAEHWAGELIKGFYRKRPLSSTERASLPLDLANHLQGSLAAIPLTGFPALSTAFANDVVPHLIFSQLVWGLGAPGDVLIGISTSGNAENVCAAIEAGKAKGLFTIALTGECGGRVKALCDVAICVPASRTHLIQEYHLPIYHCISLMLEEEFFPND